MEENKKSVVMPSLMYGIYLGLVLIVFSLVMYLLDVDQESKLMWISYLIMAAGLYLAMVNFRDKQSDGFISYGTAFGTGFWTGLFSGILTGIFLYVYVTAIDPGFLDDILLKAEEAILESSPDIGDEELEKVLSMSERFTSPVMIAIWSFIASVLFTTILSLIIAIFAKREKNPVV